MKVSYYYIKRNFNKYWGIIVAAAFIGASLIFILIKGDNIYVTVNDCLDSNIPLFKMYRDTFTGQAEGLPLVRFLGGDDILNRLFKFPPRSLKGIVYYLFPTFTAYIVMFYLRVLMSIGGWFYMAFAILDREEARRNINYIAVCGLLYGIIPVWPIDGCNFAAMPWMLGVMKRIYDSGAIRYYLIAVFLVNEFFGIPLYGQFLLGYILLFCLIELIRTRKLNFRLLWVIVIFTVVLILPQISLIKQIAGGDTIRSSFKNYSNHSFDWEEFIRKFAKVLEYGEYHCGSCQKWFIFPCCFIMTAGIILWHIDMRKEWVSSLKDPIVLTFLWAVFNALLCAIAENDAIMSKLTTYFPLLSAISLNRFVWWSPFALYLCFFLILIRFKRYGMKIVPFVFSMCAILAILFKGNGVNSITMYNDVANNIRYEVKRLLGIEDNRLTWREFYSEDLFEKIKKEINYKGEWAIAFEMHPAILSYNNICTLDGYYSGYSAAYKRQFSKLIAPFLETNSTQVSYFNDSGVRAYVFSCKPGESYGATRYLENNSEVMLIDGDVFREMGGKYVFSRVQVSNFKRLKLEFIGCFTDEESPYEIYVYKTLQ